MTTENGLASVAVLVSFNGRYWAANTSHKQAKAEVCDTNQVGDSDRVRVSVKIADPYYIKLIVKHINAARQTLRNLSAPWLQDGTRIIPAAKVADLTKTLKIIEVEYWSAVEDFRQYYQRMLDNREAVKDLGLLEHSIDWPTMAEIESRYGWELNFQPIGDPQDFRVALPDYQIKSLIDSATTAGHKAAASAAQDVQARLAEAVQHMADTLADTSSRDGKGAIVRDTLTDNVTALADLLPLIDPNGDNGQIQDLAASIKKQIGSIDQQACRDDPKARAKAATRAKQIAANVADLDLSF